MSTSREAGASGVRRRPERRSAPVLGLKADSLAAMLSSLAVPVFRNGTTGGLWIATFWRVKRARPSPPRCRVRKLSSRRIGRDRLRVESHGAVYLHHRRRGFLARQGSGSAALGALLQARGYTVRLRKLDPYLNVDPGTMSPTQHGEVFVTDDGAETDLDLGHYERFTGRNANRRTTSPRGGSTRS